MNTNARGTEKKGGRCRNASARGSQKRAENAMLRVPSAVPLLKINRINAHQHYANGFSRLLNSP
jgi:hypothetical protein